MRSLDLSNGDSLDDPICDVVLHIDEQPRFWDIAYVVYVDEKEHESFSCLLFDSDDGDGDEYRTSASARSFERCTSTRSSNRKTREADPVAAIAISKAKGRDSENRRFMQSMDAEQAAQENMNHQTSGTELELGSVSAFTGA